MGVGDNVRIDNWRYRVDKHKKTMNMKKKKKKKKKNK